MNRNYGIIDPMLRVAVGLTLIGLALEGLIGLWGYLGVLPLATGFIGFCPAYSLFGISTCPTQGPNDQRGSL